MGFWEQTDSNGWWNQYENNWVGIQLTSSFSLIGGTPTEATWYLKKSGSPTFDLYIDCYDSTGTLKFSSDAVDASTLSGTGSDITFEFTGASALATDDYFMLRTVPNSTNYIWQARQSPTADSSVTMQFSNSPWNPSEISNMTPRMSITTTGGVSGRVGLPPPPIVVNF